jgi:hypothetical protein
MSIIQTSLALGGLSLMNLSSSGAVVRSIEWWMMDQGFWYCASLVQTFHALTAPLFKRDVHIYNNFPENLVAKLRASNSRYSVLKGIKRGAQFRDFSTGNMVPRGERTPSGGAPGDCHGFYADMKATTLTEIDVLFDHAEVCSDFPTLRNYT